MGKLGEPLHVPDTLTLGEVTRLVSRSLALTCQNPSGPYHAIHTLNGQTNRSNYHAQTKAYTVEEPIEDAQ